MAIKKITLAPFTPQQVHENQVAYKKYMTCMLEKGKI